jgi:hypothetical protein
MAHELKLSAEFRISNNLNAQLSCQLKPTVACARSSIEHRGDGGGGVGSQPRLSAPPLSPASQLRLSAPPLSSAS